MAPARVDDESTTRPNNDQRSYPCNEQYELRPGFYVPTIAFFDPATEDVDVETTRKHAVRLAEAGVTGLVTHGSNGEAVHLSHEERRLINSATRNALNSAGYTDMPLIVGCGSQSTRETITLCREASESGGQFALVLPPSYYGGLLSTDLVQQYFLDIADASPLPVIIYNYPGACSGLDLSSDTIIKLSQHRNIVGVKLTCGNTGKLVRIAAGATGPFLTMGGSADFTLQTIAVGGDGTIGGLANVFPRACMKLLQAASAGKGIEAQEIQRVVARGDWVAIKGGFIAVKVALQAFYGYGGLPRRPCATPSAQAIASMKSEFAELWDLEQRC
ncbi:4-hydroxy-2-oxoglutarate aldolase-like protein 1 [Elsinoe fawcettii]|nr:4-hydroxy-2-oxoglutarate aldolase-like protein 1 [Elsinoe fawcettii]